MTDFLARIDRLLRARDEGGGVVATDRLVPIRTALLACLVLGAIAGACTGVYAMANHDELNVVQLIAAGVKVPLLFLLTLAVTFPSLYVFTALLGVNLDPVGLMRMILSAIVVTVALAASFGPITAFFALSTDNYSFMVVLTVVVFGFGGIVGLIFLLNALRGLLGITVTRKAGRREGDERAAAGARHDAGDGAEATRPIATRSASAAMTTSAGGADADRGDADADADADEGTRDGGRGADADDDAGGAVDPARAPATADPAAVPDESPALRADERAATILFRIWVVVYGLVGAQMAWVLRPFIGDPRAEFSWFRARESNFFEAAFGHLLNLFGG